jgi:hypothetical protein
MSNIIKLFPEKKVDAREKAISKFIELLDTYMADGSEPDYMILMLKQKDKPWFVTREVKNITEDGADLR